MIARVILADGLLPGSDPFRPSDAASFVKLEQASPRSHSWPHGDATDVQARSNRSAFMTFVHAATKSFTNFSWLSSCA